ncbi:uncharacterized protein PHALS_10404 [Plasmopara halstedii]|uniref:Uncharacterized protein n=1 Tax=Plasmopara halstedii TaxID=4781 RepID=A0A0P1AGW8_PLAHL|nr:uncharacterized protein PHALS_10404 [Plasmopara halstedii]CEG40192.1 hypothetical protein PHALS_10404 [Plasmopara halstedii]|eukprot:XP_024576561.1 hypothetical protein PHALS_10404 [Plasmopara halstedii]
MPAKVGKGQLVSESRSGQSRAQGCRQTEWKLQYANNVKVLGSTPLWLLQYKRGSVRLHQSCAKVLRAVLHQNLAPGPVHRKQCPIARRVLPDDD